MSEQAPLRKRSSIGKPKPSDTATQVQTAFGAAEESFGAFETAVSEQRPARVQENISEFVGALKAKGLDVSLVTAAQWGTPARDEVRAWLPSMDVMKIPACLLPYQAAIQKAALGPMQAQASAAVALCGELLDVGLSMSVADVKRFTESEREHAVAWLDVGAPFDQIPASLLPFVTPLPAANPTASTSPLEGETSKAIAPALQAQVPTEAPLPRPPIVEDADEGASRTREEMVERHMVSESPDFNRLVSTVLKEMDLDAEYDELEALLEVGDHRRDYATVYEALDKAERRALRAHGLWANATLEYKRLSIDQEQVDAALWTEASDLLEKEKEEGKRKKAIVNADIQAKIAELYPDEWRGGKLRIEKAKLVVERCLRFSELWSQKVRSLNTMLSSVRK